MAYKPKKKNVKKLKVYLAKIKSNDKRGFRIKLN